MTHTKPRRSPFCSLCGAPFKELATEEVSYEVTVEAFFILFKHRSVGNNESDIKMDNGDAVFRF